MSFLQALILFFLAHPLSANQRVLAIQCGKLVGSNLYQNACITREYNETRSTDFLVLSSDDADREERFEIVSSTFTDDSRTKKTLVLKDSDGRTSQAEARWRYEEARYPGDGENYALSLRGMLQNGEVIDVPNMTEYLR